MKSFLSDFVMFLEFLKLKSSICEVFFKYYFGGLECDGHSFAYVAHFVVLRDVWIRTQRAAEASRRATNLANHLPPI
jgi:hypothetical protein